MDLQRQQKLHLQDLITHVIPFKESIKAYELLDQRKEPSLQVVLEFES